MFPRRIIEILCLTVCLLLLLDNALAAEAGTQDNYRLGTGDQVRIDVFKEQDLSLNVLISDNGNIVYPFLGNIHVIGLTTQQLETHITKGLKGDYLVNPRVSVSIVKYRQYFINGEVKSPGSYPYAPGLTVRKAISIAGGFAERADRDDLFVLHENDADGKPDKVKIDSRLQPGDIITVEESFF